MAELFEDIKAMDKVIGAELVPVSEGRVPEPEVSAWEVGQRYRPDGTVEDYKRVEFRERS